VIPLFQAIKQELSMKAMFVSIFSASSAGFGISKYSEVKEKIHFVTSVFFFCENEFDFIIFLLGFLALQTLFYVCISGKAFD
jgi:hypothetical protein